MKNNQQFMNPEMDKAFNEIFKEPQSREEYWSQMKDGTASMPDTEDKAKWFEEYWEAHPEENAEMEKLTTESLAKSGAEFMRFKIFLKLYFERNSEKGYGEFRVVYNDGGHIMIHPLNRAGETYDFKL